MFVYYCIYSIVIIENKYGTWHRRRIVGAKGAITPPEICLAPPEL